MNPVSQIVAAARASGRGGKLDLQAFQTGLLKLQRKMRLMAPTRAEARVRRSRLRVRQLPVADCNVIDTRTDAAKDRLYFELSNGQVVRADRAEDRAVRIPGYPGPITILKGRRKGPFKNSLIREKVTAEVELNANRKAA